SQEAEYQNLKEDMETGRTEEEVSTDENRCQQTSGRREKKGRKLSSQMRKETDERKWKVRRKARQRNGRKKVEKGKHR
ncbi:MAG: hypothetical protein IJ356_08470, partial [Erysipelotrichaceae bacterium]|nr:hypothetical protein [Erysipelotrichaceae bacterium]